MVTCRSMHVVVLMHTCNSNTFTACVHLQKMHVVRIAAVSTSFIV